VARPAELGAGGEIRHAVAVAVEVADGGERLTA
jgi:hypothetical protein